MIKLRKLKPWITQEEFDSLPIRERVLIAADLFVGMRESGGANRGVELDQMQRLVTGTVGLPWCAIFVNYLLQAYCRVERHKLPENRAAVYSIYRKAQRSGAFINEPSRGTIGLWLNRNGDNWLGHVFLITGVKFGVVSTIEGNTDEAGSREGVKVARRLRTVKSIKSNARWAFIDINKLVQ